MKTGMKVLVIGSGGREHALAWGLSRSDSVAAVHSAPGNPGMRRLGPVHDVAATDLEALGELAAELKPDLVVIGPEAPLALGLGDRLREDGFRVFGPGAAGAELEASKAFAKSFMARHGVPTAAFHTVNSVAEAERVLRSWQGPAVVKASGLAAGTGVLMCGNATEALAAAGSWLEGARFGTAGNTVVIEETLEGPEASLFVVTDGNAYRLLPGAQDHKRAFDGDAGPNTGGMGAYSPAPVLDDAMLARVEADVVRPTLDGLAADGIPFRGVLFVGLMLTAKGPQVLEYNVRFGDPETQAVLPLLQEDLGLLLHAAASGTLAALPEPPKPRGAAVCVVAAAGTYPESGSRGARITGVEAAEAQGALVFHAGTALQETSLVTWGGRVLNAVGLGASLEEALDAAYRALGVIHFDGMRYRRDIARRALPNPTPSWKGVAEHG